MLFELFRELHNVALGLAHCRAFHEHHSLVEQVGEGFFKVNEAEVKENLGDEAGIEQVKNGVSHTTDILVNRSPLLRFCRIKGLSVIIRRQEAQEIPGAVHKGVHGVGVTTCWAAIEGVGNIDPVLCSTQW